LRIVRLQAGLFGDAKFFDGIGELRIDHGHPAIASISSKVGR
jgi:putative component of toxin-antitoxin plasmid stabilization module